MADLEAQVPQQVEQVFHHALSPGRLLVRQHEQQIEVGGGCEQAPAEASGGNNRHSLRIGWVGRAIDVAAGVDERQLNEGIVEQRQTLGATAPVAIAFKLPSGGRARRAQELLQTLDHGRPRRRHRARHVDQSPELAAKLVHVEIGGGGEAVFHRGQAIQGSCQARRHGRPFSTKALSLYSVSSADLGVSSSGLTSASARSSAAAAWGSDVCERAAAKSGKSLSNASPLATLASLFSSSAST